MRASGTLARASALVLFVLSCPWISCPLEALADDGFTRGRATFTDGGDKGSCGFGSNVPPFFAGWPDTQPGYNGSCGQCFEVYCDPADFKDGYGQPMERQKACRDPNRSIVISITDTCVCKSYKQWCCGDMPHLVLGRAAFKELADEVQGVIGIKWYQVACDKQVPSSSGHLSTQAALPQSSPPGNASNDAASSGQADNSNGYPQEAGSPAEPPAEPPAEHSSTDAGQPSMTNVVKSFLQGQAVGMAGGPDHRGPAEMPSAPAAVAALINAGAFAPETGHGGDKAGSLGKEAAKKFQQMKQGADAWGGGRR